jgi:polar amino acid transport system substrate-binding protein
MAPSRHAITGEAPVRGAVGSASTRKVGWLRLPAHCAGGWFAMSVAVVLATVLVVAGSAGFAPGAAATGARSHGSHSALYDMLPASVKAAGKIVDYEEPTYPPMEMTNKTGHGLTGVDIELAAAAAKVIGIKLDYVSVETFAELFPAVTSGRANLVWSGIFDAPTRRSHFTFADYFKTGTQLFIPKSEASTYTKPTQLCGHTVAGETATLFMANLDAAFKTICKGKTGLSFVTLSGVPQQILEMSEGRAQVAVAGPEIVDSLLLTTPGKFVRIGPTYFPTYYGVVFANNAFGKKLEHVIVLAIDKLIKDGSYAKILKSFGLQRQAVKASTVDKGLPQGPTK